MSGKFWGFLILESAILIDLNLINAEKLSNFSILINFTCATAKDELEKHPEMRTIAMVELENNFPSDFSSKVLKCLPPDVAKIIINPHTFYYDNSTLILTKHTMVIYIADEVHWNDTFFTKNFLRANFPVVHHLSKHLIISKDKNKQSSKIFEKLLNVVQIYNENQKVNTRSFDRTKNLTILNTFDNYQNILFHDKTKNLNGETIYAMYKEGPDTLNYAPDDLFNPREYVKDRPNCKWIYFIDLLAQQLNASAKFFAMENEDRANQLKKYIGKGKLDFFLNLRDVNINFRSYNIFEWCFWAPLPKPISITDQILFMPLDKSCWMWLGITIAVSTLIWRISEGHWDFVFGAIAHLLGQSQLIDRVKTSRVMLKVLLQLLILTFFIFSNGYQSLVTSFMLNPVRIPLLKTIDDLLESNLKIDAAYKLMEMEQFHKAVREGRMINVKFSENWWENMIELNLALTEPCKAMKHRMEIQGDGKTWKGLYMIAEPAYLTLRDVYTRPFHPYIDKFQELMDRSFEAGLHQAWERFYYAQNREIIFNYGEREKELFRKGNDTWRRMQDVEEKEILDFGLIAPFLLILVVGYVAALLMLWCEIFHRDFVSQLSIDFLRKLIKSRKTNDSRIKTKKDRTRIVRVRPRDKRNSI